METRVWLICLAYAENWGVKTGHRRRSPADYLSAREVENLKVIVGLRFVGRLITQRRKDAKTQITELVPIPKYPEVKVPYDELLAYEKANDDDYKVVIKGAPMTFSVTNLLDGVDIPGSRVAGRRARMSRPLFEETLSLFTCKPVKQNKDRDDAWLEVTKQLDKVIARLRERLH